MKLKLLFLLLALGLWTVLSESETDVEERIPNHNESTFAVVGYLPEWRYSNRDYDALCRHMTHLILFSIEVTADGSLAALDRFPLPKEIQAAREGAAKYGTKLLICFGGNSRTNGFPQMVATKDTRKNFLKNLQAYCDKHGLHGVDYNWEYPRSQADWDGLWKLIRETKAMFEPQGRVVTMAYYPDQAQESQMAKAKIHKHCDLIHMMSYDQRGRHSTWEFGKHCVDQGKSYLPGKSLTMGLPFYSRSTRTGDWKTYEDLIKMYGKKLTKSTDEIDEHYFNGYKMIQKKTRYALQNGLGGVMIWEVGQDIHPSNKKSLLRAITKAIDKFQEKNRSEDSTTMAKEEL